MKTLPGSAPAAGGLPTTRKARPPAPAPAPSRRQRAAEQTRQRIVAAARGLFHTRGFDATTTEDIAATALVARRWRPTS